MNPIMIRRISPALLALTLNTAVALAQPPVPDTQPKFYKLDLQIRDMESGKVLSARNYSMTLMGDSHANAAQIRSGAKVPVPTSAGATSFNYADVGVNFDCRYVREVDGQLAMSISADISGIQDATAGFTITRQNRWTATVLIPLKKPTIVFTADDPSSKRQMLLEVTATTIKTN